MKSSASSKWVFHIALVASLAFLPGAAVREHGNNGKGGQMKFKGLDRNNDGVITRDEWRGNDRSFSVHDRNGDGVIGGVEVGEALQDAGYDDFVDIDRDSNGRISRDEWRWDQTDFARMDVNHDGSLTRPEYLGTAGVDADSHFAVSHEVNTTPLAIPAAAVTEEAHARFSRLDRDGNGRLSRVEWDGDRKSFNALDDNNNGALSRDEVFEVSPAARKALFKKLDTNSNGTIARSEWTGDKQSFSRLDANKDDKLLQAEFLKQYHDLEVRFAGLDRDHDGKLSRLEWRGDKNAFTSLDDSHDDQVSFVEFVGVS